MVAECYLKAGIKLFDDGQPWKQYVTPADLVELYDDSLLSR